MRFDLACHDLSWAAAEGQLVAYALVRASMRFVIRDLLRAMPRREAPRGKG